MTAPEPWSFARFLREVTRDLYVYRMAAARQRRDARPVRGAQTRMDNARRRLDDAVLARARVIADERRCAALTAFDPAHSGVHGTGVHDVRCEYQRGHGPVGPGPVTGTGHRLEPRMWEHGAPSVGAWWNGEGEG